MYNYFGVGTIILLIILNHVLKIVVNQLALRIMSKLRRYKRSRRDYSA